MRLVAVFCASMLAVGASGPPVETNGGEHARLVAALERLITTGEPRHTNHDEGEWLQHAVDEAIARGDREIERLAIRAAAPIVARVSRPVASAQHPPALEIRSSVVLHLLQPVPYDAQLYASVDGAPYVSIWKFRQGQSAGGNIDRGLPSLSLAPGVHHLRLRARLTFEPPSGSGEPWTEGRDLPDLSYAIYDEEEATNDALGFVLSPLGVRARQLEEGLPELPLATWLATVLPRTGRPSRALDEWVPMFCTERTAEAGTFVREGPLCSVGHFEARGDIMQVWVRTGRVAMADSGPQWTHETPVFEGVTFHDGGSPVKSLAGLPALLEQDKGRWPRGDMSLAAPDILVVPGADGFATVKVTVRNIGQADVHRGFVEIDFGVSLETRAPSRRFVVDIPAGGAVELSTEVAFPAGYGFVFAHVMQWSEHSPSGTISDDPNHENDLMFRVVNPHAAPRDYVPSLRKACACFGF